MIFVEWLKNRLNEIKNDLGFTDFKVEVYNEQDFIKPNLEDDRICVIVKNLTAIPIYSALVQPLQVMVLSEQNGLSVAQLIFTQLSKLYNDTQLKENDNITKFQIGMPAVLNNFNIVGSGLRSVIYVNISLVELQSVLDISNLVIDGQSINFINASIGYGGNMDTIQFANGELSQSVKSAGAFTFNLAVSCQDNNLVNNAIKIMHGLLNGNKDFAFSYKFKNIEVSSLILKLETVTFATAINDIPTIVMIFRK